MKKMHDAQMIVKFKLAMFFFSFFYFFVYILQAFCKWQVSTLKNKD